MTDGFWASLHLDILWPILIPNVVIIIKLWWDGRQAKAAVKEAAKTSAALVKGLDDNTVATFAARDIVEATAVGVAEVREDSRKMQEFVNTDSMHAAINAAIDSVIDSGRTPLGPR